MTSNGVSHKSVALSLTGITKSFPGIKALDHVDLDLHAGSVHALMGENGAGKTTLINILSGVTRPDLGEFLLRGSPVAPRDAVAARGLGIATVHQEADLFPDLSVSENLAFDHGWPCKAGWIQWQTLRRMTVKALQDLGRDLDPHQPAAALTPAERQLVGIGAALAQDAAVLILDEPTSSLSGVEARILFDHLRRFQARGGAILYVSHRLEEIFELADTVTVLRDGRRVWSGPLAETNSTELIARMVGRETPPASARNTSALGPIRLACQDLTAIDGSFRDVSLDVRAGEILGVYGLIGAGRTEWAHAIVGLKKISRGQILLDGRPISPTGTGQAARLGLAYLPEDRLRLGLFPHLSVRANAVVAVLRKVGYGPFVSARQETLRARSIVEKLGVRFRSLTQPIGNLSGGNQQKVVLGRWLECEPGALLLDEPTRGVDVGAKAEIHALLRRLAETGRAIVLISSDLPEVLSHSDRVAVFRDGRLVAIQPAREATAESVAAAALPTDSVATRNYRDTSVRSPKEVASYAPSGWVRGTGLLAIIFMLVAFLTWRTDTFLRPGTLQDIGVNASLLVMCGLGAALVIFVGAVDISLGSIMALSAAVSGVLMRNEWPIAVAVLAGIATGALAGGLNAGLALLGKVHPIVITLGTMSLYRGLCLILIGQEAIHDVPASFRAPILARGLGIPAPVWFAVALVFLAWLWLGWTVSGREIMAQGSNARAAFRSGIHQNRVWFTVFMLQGALAALAGLLALGMAGNLQGTDFDEKSLEAIGVAVVGGIAITGGRGSVWGIWCAALLFRLLEKGWLLLHIQGYWQRSIVGSLLVLAILADRVWRRAGGEKE